MILKYLLSANLSYTRELGALYRKTNKQKSFRLGQYKVKKKQLDN